MPSPEKSNIQKAAEFSQKIDIITMVIGGVVYIFNPAVGTILIAGGAITYIPAEIIKQHFKKKQQ